jgi:hypothetical protein
LDGARKYDTEEQVERESTETVQGRLVFGNEVIPFSLNVSSSLSRKDQARVYCDAHWHSGLQELLQRQGFVDWTYENCADFLDFELSRRFEPTLPVSLSPSDHVESQADALVTDTPSDAISGSLFLGGDAIHYTIYPGEEERETAAKYCATHWETGLSQFLSEHGFFDWTRENCAGFLAFEAARHFVRD